MGIDNLSSCSQGNDSMGRDTVWEMTVWEGTQCGN